MEKDLLTYTLCVCVCVCACACVCVRRTQEKRHMSPIPLGDMLWVRVCTDIYMQNFQTLSTSKLQMDANEYERKRALYIRTVPM